MSLKRKKKKSPKKTQIKVKDNELHSSWKENAKDLANKGHYGELGASAENESEALKTFNEMLYKIDGQIKNQKIK